MTPDSKGQSNLEHQNTKPSSSQEDGDSPQKGRLAKIGAIVAIVGGIIAAVVAIPPAWEDWNSKRNAPSVKILSPAMDEQVPRDVTVRVQVARVPATSNVWILIKAPDPGRYYPQGRVTRKGESPILANVGTPSASTTKVYEIVAVIVNSKAAAQAFEEYCNNRSGFPKGILLPDEGIEEKAAVQVTRAQTLDNDSHRDSTCFR